MNSTLLYDAYCARVIHNTKAKVSSSLLSSKRAGVKYIVYRRMYGSVDECPGPGRYKKLSLSLTLDRVESTTAVGPTKASTLIPIMAGVVYDMIAQRWME